MGRRARVRSSQGEPNLYKKEMAALALELEKGEMSAGRIKDFVRLGHKEFERFIYLMTFTYPIYQAGTTKDAKYGILKK